MDKLDQLLVNMGWKDLNGKWLKDEVKNDVIVIESTILLICILTSIFN